LPAATSNPPAAPPAPEPEFNPFDAPPVNSPKKTATKDPFDFAPLPQEKSDGNSSPVLLENVFNSPPSPAEPEFNPFDLPPPSE